MKVFHAPAAALELCTGLALMIDPAAVSQLLLGEAVSGPALALGRLGGAGLFSLGLACWPGSEGPRWPAARRGLLGYNLLVTILLVYLGIAGEWVGVLLWPAVMLHCVLTVLLIRD